MEIDFVKPEFGDWKSIADLHIQSWRDHYHQILSADYLETQIVPEKYEEWKTRFEKPKSNQQIILAKSGQQLIGFSCFFINKHIAHGTYIDNLHVLTRFKRKGLGKLLMQKTANAVIKKNVEPKYWLWVFSENIPAKKFYEKIGGELYESRLLEQPGGGQSYIDRYVWTDFSNILQE